MRIDIKPLTVNQAWKGRRLKTSEYKAYALHLKSLLKPLKIPEGKLTLCITFGLSNRGADIDNGLKPFIDVLQMKYGFNDNQIYRLLVYKEIVKKGSEFIDFEISEFIDYNIWAHSD